MPRRKRGGSKPFRRGRGGGWVSNLRPNVVRAPFQAFFQNTMTTGNLQIAMAADNFANNLTSMATVYELYRFVELEYELLPRPTSSNILVVGYYPDATVTSPSGTATAMENLDAIVMPAVGNMTVPIKHRVPSARLRGALSWYKSTDDSSDIEFDTQGFLVFTGTGSEAVNCIVRGVCEFKNPVDASAGINRMIAILNSPSYNVSDGEVIKHRGIAQYLDAVRGQLVTSVLKQVAPPRTGPVLGM